MKLIFSEDAPKAIGPYAQAIRTGNLLYCSGQTPVDPLTMAIESPDIATQTLQCLKNLEAVLKGAGLMFTDVVNVNVYLTDMENFAKMNAVYATCLGMHRPARTTVAVMGLPLGALIEIACIAEFKNNVTE